MKLVRFLARSFHNGGLIEAGEERVVSDETVLGAHMLDVRTGLTGPVPDALTQVHRFDLAPHAGMPIAEVPGPRLIAVVPNETLEEKVARLAAEVKAAYEAVDPVRLRWRAAVRELGEAQSQLKPSVDAPTEEAAAPVEAAIPAAAETVLLPTPEAPVAAQAEPEKTEQAPEPPAPPG